MLSLGAVSTEVQVNVELLYSPDFSLHPWALPALTMLPQLPLCLFARERCRTGSSASPFAHPPAFPVLASGSLSQCWPHRCRAVSPQQTFMQSA